MSGGDYKTDAKVFPQAITGSNAGSSINGERFAYNKCAPSGALFISVSDPTTGSNVTVSLLDSLNPSATGVQSARALMTGGINLVADPLGNFGFGEFSCVERGALNADALSATRVAQLTSAALSAWSPTRGVYDRVRSLVFGDRIGDVNLDIGMLATGAQLYLENAAGSIAEGMISADTSLDAVGTSSVSILRTTSIAYAFNGAAFDRIGTGSAANLAAQLGTRAQLATAPGEWTLTNAAAADTTATATRAAGGAGVCHVLKSINASITAVAAIAAPLTVVVRDGATGVGAILWSDRLIAPVGTSDRVTISGLNIVGSANTAMTVEFTAAPGATNFETISATGFSS